MVPSIRPFSLQNLLNIRFVKFLPSVILFILIFLIIIVVVVEIFGVLDWVLRGLGHAVPSLLDFLGSGSLYVIMNIEE